MGTAKDEAEKKRAVQPHEDDYDYEVATGTNKNLEDLPNNVVWVFMERGKGNINLGNNSKYASGEKLEYKVGDDECSAEGGVTLAYVRTVKKA